MQCFRAYKGFLGIHETVYRRFSNSKVQGASEAQYPFIQDFTENHIEVLIALKVHALPCWGSPRVPGTAKNAVDES